MLKFCRESLLGRPVSAVIVVLGLCLLRAPLYTAQGTLTQVTIPRDDGPDKVINTFVETDYYILEGGMVNFRCHCLNSGIVSIVSLSWKRNGEILSSQSTCSLPLSYDLTNANGSHSGEYVCEATFSNGTVTANSAGRLGVLDSNTILAPPDQFALNNTSAALNCSTVFGESNSIRISWHRDAVETDNEISGEFDSVALADEGVYVCRLFISSYNLEITRTINFTVIVPPTILQKPSSRKHLSGNQPVTFSVQFQSRFRKDTVIVWFKNENSLVREDLIYTEYTDESSATTEVRFANLRRADSGRYRVVIVNNFDGLPQELRQVEASFELEVTVLPVAPSDILIEGISSTSARAVWSLGNQNSDDLPDNITALLYYSNETLAAQYVLDGSETSLPLTLIPGMQYSLQMSAANVDGVSKSEQEELEFQTAHGAPSTPSVVVERISPTLFTITVSFHYTGGGNITEFKISFRRINSQEEWTSVEYIEVSPTGKYLEWTAMVTSEAFRETGVDFQVKAVNTRGYISTPVARPEPIELPGPPELPLYVSSTHNSIVIKVQLSSHGASPILSLYIDFLDNSEQNITIYGNFQPGQLVLLTVGGLEPSTFYQFTVAAVNHGGKGEPSPLVEASTGELPPLPLYGIVLVSVGTALVIILCVIVLVLIVRHVHNVHKAKKMYQISGSKTSALKSESSNTGGGPELLSGMKRPSVPRLATPSVSSDTDSHRSQAYYSRQGSNSTYPISPQYTISTSDGGSPIEPFPFQRQNSVALSNDSESENNYPRYTYKVSPEPPILSTPTLTPHSLHSMQSYPSTMTRLTSSTGSSNSTRESLIVNPAEFNSTNV